MIWSEVRLTTSEQVRTLSLRIASTAIQLLLWRVPDVRLQSLKKEMDWERSTEERSASSEISTDYRLPPDPVSFPSSSVLYIPIYWLLFILVLSLYSAFIYRLRLCIAGHARLICNRIHTTAFLPLDCGWADASLPKKKKKKQNEIETNKKYNKNVKY